MHKTICMQSFEHISTWEEISSICLLKCANRIIAAVELAEFGLYC